MLSYVRLKILIVSHAQWFGEQPLEISTHENIGGFIGMKRHFQESLIVIQTKDEEEDYSHAVNELRFFDPPGHHQAIIECEGYGVKQEQNIVFDVK